MRYLGGKYRIGRAIAATIAPKGLWWEPFCGGLNVSRHLAAFGPGIITDKHAALIALYRAVAKGWCPPVTLTKEEHRAARTLPDEDPRKAFAGFACSFAGQYFRGFAGDEDRIMAAAAGPRPIHTRPARAAALSLRQDITTLRHCVFDVLDFLGEPVQDGLEAIYCDPPYAGVEGYGEAFDHARFWARCSAWATRARVFVSEYTCPVRHVLVWERTHHNRTRVRGAQKQTTERLFRVLP